MIRLFVFSTPDDDDLDDDHDDICGCGDDDKNADSHCDLDDMYG